MIATTRLRRVLVSSEIAVRYSTPAMLLAVLRSGGLPDDATIAGMKTDHPHGRIEVFITSAAFLPVPDGEPIPELILPLEPAGA